MQLLDKYATIIFKKKLYASWRDYENNISKIWGEMDIFINTKIDWKKVNSLNTFSKYN